MSENMDDMPEPRLKLAATDVEWRTFGDQIVLLDLRTSRYLSTNPAATVLWRLLEAGTTRTELVEALAETFEVPEDVAARYVDDFLDDCRRRDILRPPGE
jgi:hypothetical protein